MTFAAGTRRSDFGRRSGASSRSARRDRHNWPASSVIDLLMFGESTTLRGETLPTGLEPSQNVKGQFRVLLRRRKPLRWAYRRQLGSHRSEVYPGVFSLRDFPIDIRCASPCGQAIGIRFLGEWTDMHSFSDRRTMYFHRLGRHGSLQRIRPDWHVDISSTLHFIVSRLGVHSVRYFEFRSLDLSILSAA